MKKVTCLTIILAAILAPNIALAEKYYYHEDHLGGASIMTDEDGEIVAEYQYYPYGGTYSEEISGGDFGNSYKYTGQEEDSETGLYYYGARYYNPVVTKFMSQDPAVYDQRLFEMLRDPQMFNTYVYVLNNPIKYTDPSGEYVVETGEIEGGDTKSSITSAVNDALGIATTWDEIAIVSFFQDNFGTTNPADLVGHYTYVGTDYITDVTNSLNGLVTSFAQEVINMISTQGTVSAWQYMKNQFGTDHSWDIKNSQHPLMGAGNPYNAYIYFGHLIRYDAPGNIAFGMVGYHAKMPLSFLQAGGHYAQLISPNNPSLDDGYDQAMIKVGYTYWFQRYGD